MYEKEDVNAAITRIESKCPMTGYELQYANIEYIVTPTDYTKHQAQDTASLVHILTGKNLAILGEDKFIKLFSKQ